MNEFTKEELEDIYSAVMNTDIAMLVNLPQKIQYLIDNHDAKLINYWYCEKCGHVQ